MRGVFWLFVLLMAVQVGTARADKLVEIKTGDFTIQIAAREQANLIYQLDCLRRVSSCTSEVFEPLWRVDLGLDADDHKRLDEWGTLRREIQQSTGRDRTVPIKSSLPVFGTGDDLPWSRIQQAEFTASNAEELLRGWSAHVPVDKAARLGAIVDHFRPRFEKWWRAHETEVAGFVPGVAAAMEKARAPDLLRAAAKFYRADLGDRRLYVHVFLQPKTYRQSSQATVVGPHVVVEVEPNESTEMRVPVIVHEIGHHIFGRMPAKRKAALIEAILATGAVGPPAWHLFDEVQATVLGVLAARNAWPADMFKKRFDAKRGFYNDDAIDLGARAAERVFAEAFEKGAMRDGFAGDYVAALRAGLGAKLETPVLYLRSMVINTEADNSPWPGQLRRVTRPSSTWGAAPLGGPRLIERLAAYPGLSVAVLARGDQLPKLAPAASVLGVTAKTLSTAFGQGRGLIYVAQRAPQAYAFVFVASDDETMEAVIAAFPACRLKPGVCVRID